MSTTIVASPGSAPYVIALSDGRFVVLYEGLDSDGTGVFLQFLDMAGVPTGPSISLNLGEAGNQNRPRGDGLPGGGFVATWINDDADVDVVYNTFSPLGVATSASDILVNTATAGTQTNPDVAAFADGSFVITWQSDDSGTSNVIFKTFSSSGTPGAETPVAGSAERLNPFVVALSGTSQHVITWQEVSGSGDYDINAGHWDGTTLMGGFFGPGAIAEDQTRPSIASYAGGFVIAWETVDSDGRGIQAQQFKSDNSFLNAPFNVNTEEAGDQTAPFIVQLPSSGFLILWQSASTGVEVASGQLFSLQGPIGAELIFDPVVVTGQTMVVGAAPLTSGNTNATIAWVDVASGSIVALLKDIATDSCTILETFIVNTYTPNNQHHSRVSSFGDGFVVDWDSQFEDTSFSGVYTRQYDDVSVPVTAPARVNIEFQQPQENPDVASLLDGTGAPTDTTVSVWQSYGQDGSGYGIFGRIVGPLGAMDPTEVQVNTGITGDQTFPSVAGLYGGGFVVVWESQLPSGAGSIFGRIFDSTFADPTLEFPVSTITGVPAGHADVAAMPDEGFVVVWNVDDDGSYKIFGRRFDFNSVSGVVTPLTPAEYLISSEDPDDSQVNPRIAFNPVSSAYMVVWQQGDLISDDIYGRVFKEATNAGLVDDQLLNLNTAGLQAAPAVAANAAGGFVVTWESEDVDGDGFGIAGRQIAAIGFPETSEFVINTFTAGDQTEAAVAALDDGSFVTTWTSEEIEGPGQGLGVVGQRRFCITFAPVIPTTTPSATPSATASPSASISPTASASTSSSATPSLTPSISGSTTPSISPSASVSGTQLFPSSLPSTSPFSGKSRAPTHLPPPPPPPPGPPRTITLPPPNKTNKHKSSASSLRLNIPAIDAASSAMLVVCLGKMVSNAVSFVSSSIGAFWNEKRDQRVAPKALFEDPTTLQSLHKLRLETESMLSQASSPALGQSREAAWLRFSLEDLLEDIDQAFDVANGKSNPEEFLSTFLTEDDEALEAELYIEERVLSEFADRIEALQSEYFSEASTPAPQVHSTFPTSRQDLNSPCLLPPTTTTTTTGIIPNQLISS